MIAETAIGGSTVRMTMYSSRYRPGLRKNGAIVSDLQYSFLSASIGYRELAADPEIAGLRLRVSESTIARFRQDKSKSLP
jgi:hypothetical protein